MAQRDSLTDKVTVTVQFDDGSRIEFDCLRMHMVAYGTMEAIDLASTTRRVYDKDGNEVDSL